jgi:hypothetical protein
MFEGIRYQAARWRQYRHDARYERLTAMRKRDGLPTDEGDFAAQRDLGSEALAERVDALYTGMLETEARRLHVPVPMRPWQTGRNEEWTRQDMTETWALTPEGIVRLRAAIRAEKRDRRESVLAWAPFVTAMTGLAGTVIGLISVLKG